MPHAQVGYIPQPLAGLTAPGEFFLHCGDERDVVRLVLPRAASADVSLTQVQAAILNIVTLKSDAVARSDVRGLFQRETLPVRRHNHVVCAPAATKPLRLFQPPLSAPHQLAAAYAVDAAALMVLQVLRVQYVEQGAHHEDRRARRVQRPARVVKGMLQEPIVVRVFEVSFKEMSYRRAVACHIHPPRIVVDEKRGHRLGARRRGEGDDPGKQERADDDVHG